MNAESSTSEKTERLAYLNITFSDKGVAEFSGKRCVVFIPRDEVQRIESKTGSRAERPLVQGIAGALLSGVGLLGLRMLFTGGLAVWRWEAGFMVFGGVGVWLLWEALRKGPYLLATCSGGKRKLVFAGPVKEPELQEFLRNATRLGYICG
jgi:hypothetical protein